LETGFGPFFYFQEEDMCGEPVCTKCGSVNWILSERDEGTLMVCLNCGDEMELEYYAEQIVA